MTDLECKINMMKEDCAEPGRRICRSRPERSVLWWISGPGSMNGPAP